MKTDFLDEVKCVIESSLPSSATTVAKVVQTVMEPSSSARDVAKIIEQDPNFAADILRIANSAYYGCSTSISSLQRAVVILGYDTIKKLTSTIGLMSCFTSSGNTDDHKIIGLWYHSIGTAQACQLITMEMSFGPPDIAYTAGLLHDIGKIILALFFPEHFHYVLSLVEEKNTRFILAEHSRIKTDHTKIGKLLCDAWALPEILGLSILSHHDPTGVHNDDKVVRLAQIVELGDFMCRKAQIGFPGDEKTIEPSISSLSLLGVNPEKREENFNAISEKLEKSKPEIDNYFREFKST